MFMAPLHQQGAEPKRPLCGMQRGGNVVSKGAWQAAAQPDDYCEPDRAQREAAEGSMERGHFHGFSPSAGAAPCADCIGYPHRSAAAGQKRRNEEEVRHTFRVPILISQLSPGAR